MTINQAKDLSAAHKPHAREGLCRAPDRSLLSFSYFIKRLPRLLPIGMLILFFKLLECFKGKAVPALCNKGLALVFKRRFIQLVKLENGIGNSYNAAAVGNIVRVEMGE